MSEESPLEHPAARSGVESIPSSAIKLEERIPDR